MNTEPMKPNSLTAEAWHTIKPILITLYKLQSPAQLPMDFKIPAYANRTRHWLYKYFKEMNLKSLYKIRRDSETRLSILCQEPITVKLPSSIFSPVETFVRDHLLDIDDEAEALEFCRASLASKEITDQELIDIIDEWNRVMGNAPTKKFEMPPLPNDLGG